MVSTVVGQLIMSLLSVLPSTQRLFTDAVDGFKCCLTNKGIFTSSVGPFILGIGMTLSGAVSSRLSYDASVRFCWLPRSDRPHIRRYRSYAIYALIDSLTRRRRRNAIEVLAFQSRLGSNYFKRNAPIGL